MLLCTQNVQPSSVRTPPDSTANFSNPIEATKSPLYLSSSLPLLRTPRPLRLRPRRRNRPRRRHSTRTRTPRRSSRRIRRGPYPRHPLTHDLPTHKTNPQHHHPPGHTAHRPHEIPKRLQKPGLGQNAVKRVQHAVKLVVFQISRFSTGGDGGEIRGFGFAHVQGDDVHRDWGGFLPGSGCWGNEEVVDDRAAGGPGGAEDFVFFAIEDAEAETRGAGGGGEGGEEGDGLLEGGRDTVSVSFCLQENDECGDLGPHTPESEGDGRDVNVHSTQHPWARIFQNRSYSRPSGRVTTPPRCPAWAPFSAASCGC